MKLIQTLTCLALLAAPAAAQDLTVKAPPQATPILLYGGTVHPVSSAPIADGYVLFENGRITDVGVGRPSLPGNTVAVDVSGKHVYPGLIGAVTQIGLTEISSVRAMQDTSEVGRLTPEVRAAVAVNPDSTLIPVTRSNGILTVGVFPDGGDLSGRAAVLQLEGWTWEDMALVPDAGQVVRWPLVRPVRARWMRRSDNEQQDSITRNIRRIEEVFEEAQAYVDARAADESTPVDVRWEAMRPVLRGDDQSRPVFLFAQEHDQIVSAVSFAERFGLDPVIVGGRDAPLCAELLKERDVPVIVLGTHRQPRRDDSPYDEAFQLPFELEQAGVRWCLASGKETAHERELPQVAATAAAHGLPPEVALRSITLSAADVLGVGDRLGSLEKGKLATLIVTDGDPLEMVTRVQRAWVAGKEIPLSNKQTVLRDKYREKYRQIDGR